MLFNLVVQYIHYFETFVIGCSLYFHLYALQQALLTGTELTYGWILNTATFTLLQHLEQVHHSVVRALIRGHSPINFHSLLNQLL